MNRQEKWLVVIAALLFVMVVLLVATLWVVLSPFNPTRLMGSMPMMGGSAPLVSGSNGERIFKTGINARGEAIPSNMMPGMGGCAMCHGPDGHGGQMMGRPEPCNTFKCLSADGYTEDLIKRAITQGIDQNGKQLDLMMPRWQMSESDLNDLIGYLKTLP